MAVEMQHLHLELCKSNLSGKTHQLVIASLPSVQKNNETKMLG